jgi:DNA-binding CsgD family transcriptional regulator
MPLAMRRLVASSRQFTLAGDPWANIERRDKRQLLVHQIELEEGSATGPDCVLVLVDLDLTPVLSAAALQKVFHLTAAEARLACEIATGKPLAEIAAGRGLSMSTCRTQLKVIFAKTRTRRQAELVALLTRISILP